MEKFTVIAKTFFGFEEILAKEIKELGGEDVKELRRAVSFTADTALLYRANLCLRTAIKLLKPMAEFKAWNEKKLYAKIKQIDWEQYIDVDGTFAVDAVTYGEVFRHSKYAALTVKDAIVDQFREKYDKRPSIDTEEPDLQISIHIAEKECSLSFDSSGIPLSKRGYKSERHLLR